MFFKVLSSCIRSQIIFKTLEEVNFTLVRKDLPDGLITTDKLNSKILLSLLFTKIDFIADISLNI